MCYSGKLTPLTEYALIPADERGLAFDHVFSNHRLRGWLIILNSQLYSMVAATVTTASPFMSSTASSARRHRCSTAS
jgi:hypothetical protein